MVDDAALERELFRVGGRFMPGCLVFSLIASIVLTILLNLVIRAF